MGFTRRTGERDVKVFNSVGTIAAKDIVQFDENGEVDVCATNKNVLGIALEAATSSTTVHVDVLQPGDEVEATISAGTMATEEIGEEADIADANDLTLTESNNDFIITGWDGVTTTKCFGYFKFPVTGGTVKP